MVKRQKNPSDRERKAVSRRRRRREEDGKFCRGV